MAEQNCLVTNDWICGEYLRSRSQELTDATVQHIGITVVSVLIGLAVAFPMALLARRGRRFAGPVLGLIDPVRDFGALREPIIKLAVAVILFEGGLSLKFRELRHAGIAVFMLVFIGVPVGWALGTAAAYYGAGLPFELAALFGGGLFGPFA